MLMHSHHNMDCWGALLSLLRCLDVMNILTTYPNLPLLIYVVLIHVKCYLEGKFTAND